MARAADTLRVDTTQKVVYESGDTLLVEREITLYGILDSGSTGYTDPNGDMLGKKYWFLYRRVTATVDTICFLPDWLHWWNRDTTTWGPGDE